MYENEFTDLEDDVDMVNHPPHYNKGIETTEYIKSRLTLT